MNEQEKIEVMRAAGISDDEILRLADLKKSVVEVSCDDLTIESKRLEFLKFQLEHGLIGEAAEPGKIKL